MYTEEYKSQGFMALHNPHLPKKTPYKYIRSSEKKSSPGHLLKSVSYLLIRILALLMQKPADQKTVALPEWERNKGTHAIQAWR